VFGNNGVNVNMSSTLGGNLIIDNPNIYAGTTLAATEGIRFTSSFSTLYVYGGAIGVTSAHSTGDLVVQTTVIPNAIFYGTEFGSATVLANQSTLPDGPDYMGIRFMDYDNVSLDHRRYLAFGTAIRDTTTLSSVSLSERMTPSSATVKMTSSCKKVAVANGQTVTVEVKVRKSVVGDGTAYNGAQPRLMLRRNDVLGITSDTVIDTATASADGAYETLTGTTAAASQDGVFEFYVDCDGTTGWVNLYDWSTNRNNDPRTTGYWSDGVAYMGAEYNTGGGGGQRSYVFG
jgi:hypothetical protein